MKPNLVGIGVSEVKSLEAQALTDQFYACSENPYDGHSDARRVSYGIRHCLYEFKIMNESRKNSTG